jgi:hypothetical protein
MGYITEQNKKAVEDHIVSLMMDLKTMRNGLGLNADGINWVGGAALDHFGQFGKVDLRRVIELADEARRYATFRDDYPHPGDKHLAWLQSVEDIREASVEKMRRFTQEAAKAEQTRDASGKTLYERYCARVLWLGENNVHRAPEPVQEIRPLTEKEKQAAAVKTDLDAIRAEIDAIPGYSPYADSQRKRLHKRLNELLADRSFKFYDRYSQETFTGLEAIKRQMAVEQRDKDNPIR